MRKFLKIIKTLQESLIRNSLSNSFQQLSNYSHSADAEKGPFFKRYTYKRDVINKIQRTRWCLGSNLGKSFLSEIPHTLTITRGFSSRYMVPPKVILKPGSKEHNEVDRLTIIPAWMKRTKIRKFKDNLDSVKNKNQNKNYYGFNASGPKFKMTNLINKKSKTVQLMTESLKPKNFYKTVLNKISLPLFETKHLILKKKNNVKGILNNKNGLEDTMKKVINANIPENYKAAISRYNYTDNKRNKKVGQSNMLECKRNSPDPVVADENNAKKSLVVPENKLKQCNKNDDRSRIRRYKTKNVIFEQNQKLLKVKAKHFEKPEVDMYIKKLAAKYGKTVVQKSARPRRIYENNRQRVKYDVDTEKNRIKSVKVGPTTHNVMANKIEANMSHYSKRKLCEFIKRGLESNRVSNQGYNQYKIQRTTPYKTERKPKRDTILKREDSMAKSELVTRAQDLNKRANSKIKLNSKNGLLKGKNKHAVSTEIMNNKLEMGSSSNSTSFINDKKEKEPTNGPEITPHHNIRDQIVPNIPRLTSNKIKVTNSEKNKSLNGVISSTDVNNESSKNVNKTTKHNKNDSKTQVLTNNQNIHINQLMISDSLSNKINEFPTKTEAMARECKNSHLKGLSSTEIMENQSTEPSQKLNKDKDQQVELGVDQISLGTEQIKHVPDSPNYISSLKPMVSSCKYKKSNGVHINKANVSRRLLRKAHSDFKSHKKENSNIRSNNSKISNKKAILMDTDKNLPSKVEFGKIVEKTLSLPMKIYKFHCHKESKCDSSPSINLATESSNNSMHNLDNIKIENLEQLENFKKRDHEYLVNRKKKNNLNNEKLTNINTVRLRIEPKVNLKNNEFIKKLKALRNAQQPENHPLRPLKRENLPSMDCRVLDVKKQNYGSQNQSNPISEEANEMKEKPGINFKNVGNMINYIEEGKKNKDVSNLHSSNIILSDIQKQIKVENSGANFRADDRAVNDGKVFFPRIAIQKCNTEQNIDYSRRELKKILPFLKNLGNEIRNNPSKAGPEEKETEHITGKEPTLRVKGSTHNEGKLEIPKKNQPMLLISKQKNKSRLNDTQTYPNVPAVIDSRGWYKKDNLNLSATENLNFKIQKNELLKNIGQRESIKQISPSSQQPIVINKKNMERNMLIHDIKNQNKNTIENKNKTVFSTLSYEDTTYELKKQELENHYPTVLIKYQTKQHTTEPLKNSKYWAGMFQEMVIHKHILEKKLNKHVFLTYSYHKEPFLNVMEDIHQINSGMTFLSSHTPMFGINTDSAEEKYSKKIINKQLILENNYKNMLYQQLDLYNREIKQKDPRTMTQNENLIIYDIFDCTFILQCFNKTSLNCESSKHLVGVTLGQSSSLMNDLEFNNDVTEKMHCHKSVPMQVKSNKTVFSNMIKQINTCGKLIVKQNPKDVSIFEELDYRIPMMSIKNTVKEASNDDLGSQIFNNINSKHMRFYSNYRMNCMGKNVIMGHNTGVIIETPERKKSGKQETLTSNKVHNSGAISKTSTQEMPMNMKIKTFEEICKYNKSKNDGNRSQELESGRNRNSEKECSLEVKTEKVKTNLCAPIGSQLDTNNSFSDNQNSNVAKIEPEVLHYMKKFDTLSSNMDFKKLSNRANTLGSNTNEVNLKSEKNQEKSLSGNETYEHINNYSNHYEDEKTNSKNLFLKEITKSNDIQFLEKNSQNHSNEINECRRGTFEYLTTAVKKHKSETQNVSSLTSLEALSSKNHLVLDDVKKSSNQKSKFPSLNLKTECSMTSPNSRSLSVNKHNEDSNKHGINLRQNVEGPFATPEINNNKLKAMINVKEQEKQPYFLRNLEKSPYLTKNEESDTASNINQIANNSKLSEPNIRLKTMTAPVQNKLMSLVNKESRNRNSSQNNTNQKHKNKSESVSKIGPTTGMNDFKNAGSSFEGIWTKKDCNVIKTISANIQNYNNSLRSRQNINFDNDNMRNYNDSGKAVCKVHSVLNKKYASRLQKSINKETQSNLSLSRDEVNNFTKTLKSQNKLRNPDKIAEKELTSKATTEQKEEEKITGDITKPTTDNNSSDQMTNMDTSVIEDTSRINDLNDNKNITGNKIILGNANESYITESIPTGLRCMRQHKIEADKDNGLERTHLKKPIRGAKLITLRDKRKRLKSPIRNEISNTVVSVKPMLNADCSSNSHSSQCSLKHKNQLDNITKDKRIKSIKNKLAKNLKPKDENKSINKQSHTLKNFIIDESVKKKCEEQKRDSKKRKKDGFCFKKRDSNKMISSPEYKEQAGLTNNKIGIDPETGQFTDHNFFVNGKSSLIQILTEGHKPSFNIISSENNFKQSNEHKDVFSNAENKEESNIGSTSVQSLKKKVKKCQKKEYREKPTYILKTQPKEEGFISQTLRSSNSQRCPASKMFTVGKIRQTSHLIKHKSKSEHNISNLSGLKNNISKPCTLKSDQRLNDDQKKNNLKQSQSNELLFKTGLPFHNFHTELKNISKNYVLDTPTRQVCGLMPPKPATIEKPLRSNAKVTTKLIACTKKKGNSIVQNFDTEKNIKHFGDDIFISKIPNIQPIKEYKTSLTDLYPLDKDSSVSNISESKFDASKANISKHKNQSLNLLSTKDLIADIQLFDQNKPPHGNVAKVPEENNLSNSQLMTNSNSGMGLHTIVGNVVNNVKTKIQNFLLTDIAKSKINRGVNKNSQVEINNFKEKNIEEISKDNSREKNRLPQFNQSTKQLLYKVLSSYPNGSTKEVQPIKRQDKMKRKSKNKYTGASHRRKTISDLLKFKPDRNKQTCPQMSYSEVLNKFYTGCET